MATQILRKESRRKKLEILRGQLENEYASFQAHHRDLSEYILPRRSRFFPGDSNKGDKRNQNILDSTATRAAEVCGAGIHSSVTSPARPWFELKAPEPWMNELENVKLWLYTVTQRMQNVFLKSNLYHTLPEIYMDLCVFGTGCMLIEEDFNSVLRCYTFPVGEYLIANDDKLKVCVFFRKFQYTVRQLVKKFGTNEDGTINWENLSTTVKEYWDNGLLENWIEVCHVIMPNPDYDPKKALPKFKKYTSYYYESGFPAKGTGYMDNSKDDDRFLMESGYDYFPVLAPRWQKTGVDVYGTNCPGMASLGDIKQLQKAESKGLQALEKMVNPPMVADPVMQNRALTLLPGKVSYVPNRSNGQPGFFPAHETNFNLDHLENKQEQVRNRIDENFYVNLFLMLAQLDRKEITATEIMERRDEKFVALGPVVGNIDEELLKPLIDIAYLFMERQGFIPDPIPEELVGMDLKVVFVSIMAQAQKAIGVSSMERFLNVTMPLKQEDPNVEEKIGDKIDMDQFIDRYADAIGIPPDIVRSDDKVSAIRASRKRDQQAMAAAAQAKEMAGAAQQLSKSNMSTDNALTRLISEANAGNLSPATLRV